LHDIKRMHAETEVMVMAYGSLQSAMDCIRHGAAVSPKAVQCFRITGHFPATREETALDHLRPVLANRRHSGP
jgi:hypothetical protein